MQPASITETLDSSKSKRSLVIDQLSRDATYKTDQRPPAHQRYPTGLHHGVFDGRKFVLVSGPNSIDVLRKCGAFGFLTTTADGAFEIESEPVSCLNPSKQDSETDGGHEDMAEPSGDQNDSQKDHAALSLTTGPGWMEQEENAQLLLNLQESFFLSYALGCLIVHRSSTDEVGMNINQLWEFSCAADPHFVRKYAVYHFYRSQGYTLTGGVNYGVHFMLYPYGPAYSHSLYGVIVRNTGDDVALSNWRFIIGKLRDLHAVNKGVIIADVISEDGSESIPDTNSSSPECLRKLTVRQTYLANWFPGAEAQKRSS